MSKINFIDVFSGAGGLSCGMELAGHKCVLGVEIDKHAASTFAHNHKHAEVHCGDIRELTPKRLKELLNGKKVDAVIGGPPCQGFSTAGKGDPNDIRNTLFREFVRIVRNTSPNFVVIENVTGILAKKNEATLSDIFKQFEKLGFHLDVQVMSSEEYGVPEKRRRTIILGTKLNTEINFPNKRKKIVTVGDVITDLKTKKGEIHNHDESLAQVRSKIDLDRLKHIPEGKGIRYQKDEEAYLPKRLRFDVNWDEILEGRFRQTKYQRLDRGLPSPTIMTHRYSYFHPTEHRYLTQREAAKMQSFPNDFVFMGPISAQWRQIGNAVPPLLGKAIGQTISKMCKAHLENEDTSDKKKRIQKKSINTIREKAFVYKKKEVK
ncbi:MAG: DNA cytosine methyltransferase [Bacteriovoracaceae bacterium]|nr:DNA cytosine methyltransferase [Bacteriovoracaceae bacterium]